MSTVARKTPTEVEPRNAAKEMDAVIEKARIDAGHSYNSRELARTVVANLRRHDPALLQAWLEVQAETLLWRIINLQDASNRGHDRIAASRSVFRRAADAAAEGDTGPVTAWLSQRYVVEGGGRVKLAEMTKPDLEYVATGYESRIRQNQMQAAFMKALARKVRNRTVGDVFSEDEISQLWRSITAS